MLVPSPGPWLAWAVAVYAIVVTAMVLWLSDRWTIATLLAFGPRWMLLLPVLGAAPVVAWFAPRRLWLVALALVLIAGPAMGWSPGLARFLAPSSGPGVRILEYNAEGGEETARRLDEFLARWRPDVAVFEECGDSLAEALSRVPGTALRQAGAVCMLSRLPVTRTDTLDRSAFEAPLQAGFGGSAWVLRIRVTGPTGPLAVIGLHLETPRKGLEVLLHGDASAMEGNTIVRGLESERARRFIAEDPEPFIVAGDFNLPPESAIYRTYWSDLRNAWNDAGVGYGYTKRDRPKIRVRIDHVLSDGRWRAWHAEVGEERWSDHQPLIVDLRPAAR